MSILADLQSQLRSLATVPKEKQSMFFKTGSGHYAEHDIFIGVTMPALRTLAQKFHDLSLDDMQELLKSPINEERQLALIILVHQYQKTDDECKDVLYNFYLHNLKHVNNWNLVDSSAHLIIGDYLYDKKRDLLITLAQSNDLWERRVAIIATFYFIRKNDLAWTFKIATLLLQDTHDLIHKAVGWMLREAGKRDQQALLKFLDLHAQTMPRTMLRYAIEKLSADQKKKYMARKQNKAQ